MPDRFTASLPGNPAIGQWPCVRVFRSYSCKGLPRRVTSIQVFAFRTDAQVIELAGVVPDGSATSQTLIVDGRLVPPKVLTSSCGRSGWNFGSVRIAFPTRRVRDIWIETGMALAYLRIGESDTLYPLEETGPQLSAIGDSYLQVSCGRFGNGGAIALGLAARLGIRKIATDAIGGTGYWNSGVDLGNLGDRLAGHSADNSAIYLVMAGLNDYGDRTSAGTLWPSRETFENAVLSYLQGLRAAQPDAVIVVTAPFCPIAPMSDSSYVTNPMTNSSGQGDFLYKAQLFRQCLQQIAGPWVFIDVLMGTGWLNSSGATGDITHLQWFTGGTPGPGTSEIYKPGNTLGGSGGGYGGIANVPIINGGRYTQAPEITASGGTGSGLLLWGRIDSSGTLTEVNIISPGAGYTDGAGLPAIQIDTTYEQVPAVLGMPARIVGINPDGQYPLLSFAPPGVTANELNNIYELLERDLTHPAGTGAEYLARRLAKNIHDAILAL